MAASQNASPLTIVHIEAGRHLYGGALQVKYLLEGLKHQAINNVLVCPPGAEIAQACAELNCSNLKIEPCEIKGDLDFALVQRLSPILQRHQADIVHIHSRRGADLWGARAAAKAKLPCLLTRRVDNSEPSWLARWKYGHWYDEVVAISDGIRQVLIDEGVAPQRVRTIRSVVDTQLCRPEPDNTWFCREFGYQSNDKVLAIVAQLIERKGHKVLFEAIAPLFDRYSELQLMVLGKGPLADELAALVKHKGLEDRIKFFGFRQDIHRILPNLYAVAHPAFTEGLGVALLQAAACGVPVVASRAGGIPEAVADGEHGLLVPPGEPDTLRSALETLISKPDLRAQFSLRARERMVEEFSIAAMAQQYVELYQTLVK